MGLNPSPGVRTWTSWGRLDEWGAFTEERPRVSRCGPCLRARLARAAHVRSEPWGPRQNHAALNLPRRLQGCQPGNRGLRGGNPESCRKHWRSADSRPQDPRRTISPPPGSAWGLLAGGVVVRRPGSSPWCSSSSLLAGATVNLAKQAGARAWVSASSPLFCWRPCRCWLGLWSWIPAVALFWHAAPAPNWRDALRARSFHLAVHLPWSWPRRIGALRCFARPARRRFLPRTNARKTSERA